MSQPSVANYFTSRKRSAYEDNKINRVKKVLVLDNVSSDRKDGLDLVKIESKSQDNIVNNGTDCVKTVQEKKEKSIFSDKIAHNTDTKIKPKLVAKRKGTSKTKNCKSKNGDGKSDLQDIQLFLQNVKKQVIEKVSMSEQTIITEDKNIIEEKRHITPPSTPVKTITNALDKVKNKLEGPSLKEIKKKMSRSSRLAELKASMARFQANDVKLKEVEEKTQQIPESPKLKSFKSIEIEVQTSPQKVYSPEKSYLSPKKDISARRNLIHLFSPTKNAVPSMPDSPSKQTLEEISKPALTLPFKYRYLAEMFRCIDTICQILFNRKETITFKKLKPAVEEMLKRNLLEKHLCQLKQIYPDAFEFCQEKLKVFGNGMKHEQWELVIKPNLGNLEHFNSDVLLQRRRKLFNILLDKVKDYHQEFLTSLDPPMVIPKDKITRWHPEFDIERIPDIDLAELPQRPTEEKLTTGKDVLEKAKELFHCNTRMEQALQKLKETQEKNAAPVKEESKEIPQSLLKGIPKALLEKVRQKQAAKALISMTRSADQEKELQIYSRLPEIARLTRNLFVSEKKSVLPLDVVVEKLGNCYRTHLSKTEMEEHLKVIAKEIPTWLVFHNIRNCAYLKIAKNDDLSLILKHLENLAKQKSEW